MATLPGDALDAAARREPLVFLNSRGISDAGATALALCMHIRVLHLRDNAIGDAGAIAFALLPELCELDLSYNLITDAGAVALARSTSLRILHLNGNGIGDVGAAALARNTTLEQVYMYSSAISDVGAAAFAQNTTLRRLSLDGLRMSDAGAAEIATALEAGNACALTEAELCYVKRAVGQHAFGVLLRFVRTGNRSLRHVFLGITKAVRVPTLVRIQNALNKRQFWADEVKE